MVRSIVRRSLYAILTLWIISVISFWLSKQIPGDEVEDYLTIDERGYSTTLNPIDHRAAYARVAHKRKLDLPLFTLAFLPVFLRIRISSFLLLTEQRYDHGSPILKTQKGPLIFEIFCSKVWTDNADLAAIANCVPFMTGRCAQKIFIKYHLRLPC